MQGNITNAFGKLQRDESGAVTAWHPLVDHLIDIAVCYEGLCRCRSIRRALETTAGRTLQPRDIARLAVHGSPAFAGIGPDPLRHGSRSSRFPRVRGDRPLTTTTAPENDLVPPRPRG